MPERRIRLSNFNWPTGLFIIGYHLALLVGLPFYFVYSPPGWPLVAITVALLVLTELGITTAYHRYYAHRAYDMHPAAEAVLLGLGTLAIQGSVLGWAADHRKHHKYVDSDDDPYAITKGFWYAHMLWMFEKSGPIDESTVRDLTKKRIVRFQDKHFALLGFGGNLLLALAIGWALDDFLGAIVLAWWTRMAVGHHLTWFINSLAHTWGERTYSREHSAVDNYVIAFLTVGEGYHNYHHTFASDYRNGVRWYHFDPGKWTIWTLNKLGLAGNLKRYNTYSIKRRLLQEDRKLLLETLKDAAHQRRVELEARIHDLAELMQEKLQRLHALAEELRRARRARGREARERLDALRREIRQLQESLRGDWKSWRQVCGLVLDGAPA